MKLIFKYLKPHVFTVLVIVGLIFGQVSAELALPDYMSDIVTNGIQYGGINENVPLAVSAKDMKEILVFVDNQDDLLSNYDLINHGEEVRVKNQLVEFKEDVYVLKEGLNPSADLFKDALVYSYLAKMSKININDFSKSELISLLENSYNSIKSNLSSVNRIYIGDLYEDVGVSTLKIQNNYILIKGLQMLGISFVAILIQIVSTYLATKISSKIASLIRKDVFEKIESFSSSEFSNFSTSSLITRTGNDIVRIQQLIQIMLRMMIIAPMTGIMAALKVVRYPQVSWILLIAVAILMAVIIVLIILVMPKFEMMQKLKDRINSVTREALDGMLVVRAFNSEKHEEKKFEKVNKETSKIDLFVNKIMNIVGPFMTLTMNMLTIGIIWYSTKLIDIDLMGVGDMMAFIQYALNVVMSFMMMAMVFVMIPYAFVSVKRVEEVLDTEVVIKDKDNPVEIDNRIGDLVFDHVYFKYPNAQEYVLNDICFKASPKQTVALIGSTGSGKSTISKLIPRLFDVTDGSITYDGINIKDIRQKDLHNMIGFVSQKAVLFSGTIKSNIEFGRNVNDDELNNAIAVSQSTNIIENKEEGVNTVITQGGTNVSGGQKQRLSIARALAKKAQIYIFDDSFSALDYATDKKLRAELSKMTQKTKAIVIIVAQRISTIKNADKIIVLDEGKIVGEGTHEELLKSCDVYYQIASSQLTKEELENAKND